MAIRRELGDERAVAESLNNLGVLAQYEGDYARAGALFEQSLLIRRGLGDKQGISYSLQNLGYAAQGQGDPAGARAYIGESLAICTDLGDSGDIANALFSLGFLTLDTGDPLGAKARLEESLLIWREMRYYAGIALALEGLVGVAATLGAAARAMRLAGAASALRAPIGVPTPPFEEARLACWVDLARQALDEGTAGATLREGQAMTLDQAIAYAPSDADAWSRRSPCRLGPRWVWHPGQWSGADAGPRRRHRGRTAGVPSVRREHPPAASARTTSGRQRAAAVTSHTRPRGGPAVRSARGGAMDEWQDPADPAFLGAMRGVFEATWSGTMGRRWPALAGDVDALCARGRHEAVDALGRGLSST
jgi:hypothetical protein